LAFGSCSSDSGSGSEEPPPSSTDPTGPTVVAPPTVVAMTVVKHPMNPSYEGAYPDLTGLEVQVKWSNGDEKIVDDPTLFTVFPPVAFVTTAGSSEKFSPKGRYLIQYNGDDGIYDLNNYSTNVYIPYTIAMALKASQGKDAVGNPLPLIDGKLPEVYEDQGVKAGELNFKAKYVDFAGGSSYTAPLNDNDIPKDAYYLLTDEFMKKKDKNGDLVLRDEWLNFDASTLGTETSLMGANIKSNPVSSNKEAWIVNTRPAVVDEDNPYTATYRTNLNGVALGTTAAEPIVVPIKKFYRVDRLRYVSGIENVPVIAADDKDLSGDNTTSAPVNWWKALNLAGLKFQVIYYRVEGDEEATPTRDITMADYVKAMFTGDEQDPPRPRATLPILSGNTGSGGVSASGVQHSVINDYPLTLSLFYYAPGIEGTIGKGTVSQTVYENANAATIPITDSNLIATFNGFTPKRYDISAHPSEKGGEPTITGAKNLSEQQNRDTLFLQLKNYWKVYWNYENPRNPSEPVLIEAKWPDTSAGITDYDFSDIEAEETRQCSVLFAAPGSAAGDDDEVEFDYIIAP